ncbi:hypothetical protein ACIB24_21780 [Spongisporangium articulatum]|uniref:Mce-associated membrane protein n=1 Tax=Spongisporangium articulatum TaxID=3362603 RepID=A0ABW8ATK9_9ACTN
MNIPTRLTTVRRPAAVPAALMVVALCAAGFSGWATWRSREHDGRAADSAAAVAAARQEVLALTTVSKGTAAASLERLRLGAAEPFASDIAQSSGALQQVLTAQDVTSQGVIVESGISSIDADSAVVLLAADATVTSASAAPAVRHYRMSARMSHVGDRWLVSDLEFVS